MTHGMKDDKLMDRVHGMTREYRFYRKIFLGKRSVDIGEFNPQACKSMIDAHALFAIAFYTFYNKFTILGPRVHASRMISSLIKPSGPRCLNPSKL